MPPPPPPPPHPPSPLGLGHLPTDASQRALRGSGLVRQGGRFGRQALPRSRGASGKPNQAYEAGTESVSEGSIIKRMLVHLWPKDEPALKVGLSPRLTG